MCPCCVKRVARQKLRVYILVSYTRPSIDASGRLSRMTTFQLLARTRNACLHTKTKNPRLGRSTGGLISKIRLYPEHLGLESHHSGRSFYFHTAQVLSTKQLVGKTPQDISSSAAAKLPCASSCSSSRPGPAHVSSRLFSVIGSRTNPFGIGVLGGIARMVNVPCGSNVTSGGNPRSNRTPDWKGATCGADLVDMGTHGEPSLCTKGPHSYVHLFTCFGTRRNSKQSGVNKGAFKAAEPLYMVNSLMSR